MSDWPDIKAPAKWEQKPNPEELENARLTSLTGGSWAAEDIAVIRWMTNVDPPRWAMWIKSQLVPSEPEEE